MSANENGEIAEPKAPEWATQPLGDFLKYITQLAEVVDLSTAGIQALKSIPVIEGILDELSASEEKLKTPHEQASREKSRRLAKLAHRESSTGFPLIHAQATVSLWGALEDLIRTFVASWLRQVPAVLVNPPLSTIKVEVGDYEKLSPEEKGLFLADALDREVRGPLAHGVTRFEALLKPLGLSGSVPDSLKKDIFELGQVRHLIAHRRGIADRKLMNACPWLNITLGSPFVVSHADFARYYGAVHDYALELTFRIAEHFGVPNLRERVAAHLAELKLGDKGKPNPPGQDNTP